MELNRGQTLGLNLDMHVVLDAGAGTGKTACIVQRVLEHYLSEDQRATRLLPPGPRDVDFGGGILQTPAKDRENLREWRGLLPTEVVVLTFTVKAAEEMRERLRKEISRLRPGPRGERDGFRFDPRIRNEGLIEQLTMLLDEAPIGTIDSFLNRLVSAHRNLLGERPTHEQMSDAQRALLMEKAMAALWRIRSVKHAGDLQISSVSPDEFLLSRNRLSHQLGGRKRTQKIVAKLLQNSIFVDSVRRSLQNSSGKVDAEALRSNFISHLEEGEINDFAHTLFDIGEEWLDGVKQRAVEMGLATAFQQQTRVNCLDTLIDEGIPDDLWGKLLWIRHFSLSISSLSSLEKDEPSAFPNKLLSSADAWPSGVNKLSSIKDKDAKNEIEEILIQCQNNAKRTLSSMVGLRMRKCSIIAELMDPRDGPPHCPKTSSIHLLRIQDPFPTYTGEGALALGSGTDARIISDLLTVHRAAQDVMTELRILEGLHDHSDVTESAEDLLLTRCPRVCSRWYPQDISLELNKLDEEKPWEDGHILSALQLCGSPEDGETFERHSDYDMKLVKSDLERRFDVLKVIRRRFRAFIIDEAQDNSNQQWRLLARLWGERLKCDGDPDQPESPWQPTVCWVGDQKQSIYGFRQAQVSGMSRYTVHLRAINEHEYASESRLLMKPALRRRESSRDPRLVNIESFVSGLEYVNHRPIPEEAWVQYDRGDDDRRLPHTDVIRRTQGHIDLVTNYRTCNDLLQTMNEWWEDLFDGRHNLFPGDWYASPKGLRAHRQEENGSLEWLLPISTGESADPPKELTTPLDPYKLGSAAKQVHLEHELIAARIRSLIDGSQTSVLPIPEIEELDDDINDDSNSEGPVNSEGESQLEEGDSDIECEIQPVDVGATVPIQPKDVMVLMPSRTHMHDLVRRLDNLGIPALADQDGGLLEQPVVEALLSLVQTAARRRDKSRAATLARSPLVGFNDQQLENYLMDKKSSPDLLERLEHHAINGVQKSLFKRWKELADCNRLIQMLEDTLDHSDLLIAYPGQVDRQYAEQFLALVQSQMAESGGDPVLLSERLKRLSEVNGKLLPGDALPPSNAVRVMTIHGSKGLQSKVVVVCGLFSENQSNLKLSKKDNILVSQQMFSPRPRPWKSRDSIKSGSWSLSEAVLTSQVQAEARRLLYVACTRVKDRLILAGAPKKASIDTSTGSITLGWKFSPTPRFGWMWLEALRQAAGRNGDDEAPWLIADDSTLPSPLPFRKSGSISFAPSELLTNSSLSPGLLPSMLVYHHPGFVYGARENSAPMVQFTRLQESARLVNPLDLTKPPPRQTAKKMRIAPHALDSANNCLRRHWLNHYIGISQEPVRLPYIPQDDDDDTPPGSGWPAANVLGTLFHRLVELGIPNPGPTDGKPSTPLSEQWITESENRMSDPELISQVLDELLPADTDRELVYRLLERMAENVLSGKLGRLVKGDTIDGMKVEALRTEWPFLINIDEFLDGAMVTAWNPREREIIEEVMMMTLELDGVADLVLCETDDKSRHTIRAIDLKTTEALMVLKPPENVAGTLYELPMNPDDETERTFAELNLLSHYRMQLYLYHLCLVRQEKMREENGMAAREVVKPAILVATTGRLISWTDEEFEDIKQEFKQLMFKLSWVDVIGFKDESNFERKPQSERKTCESCQYFRGALRLCAPQGEALGYAKSGPDDDERPKVSGDVVVEKA